MVGTSYIKYITCLLVKYGLDNLQGGGGGGYGIVGVEREDHQLLDPISFNLCQHLMRDA